MNFINFKKQDDGSYIFDDGKNKITYDKQGQLFCYVDNKEVFSYKYLDNVEAMLNASNVYEKYCKV